jgi:peptidoglycan LD-endopeptidase CwlK
MSFQFGEASEANLLHVESGIVRCARRAIVITTQDFGVFEGIRMLARQRLLVSSGASRTLDSYHIPDEQGIGHALDLVPFIDGRLQWQMPCCLLVAAAMHRASLELSVPLTWGAVWDRHLGDLDPRHLASEVQRYRARYYAAHPAVFEHGEWHQPEPLIDAPHFQGMRAPKALPA